MKVTRGYSGQALRPYPVGTIGNFDGHHRGHHALLQRVIETARKKNGTAVVLSFDPHPVKILAPRADFRFLTNEHEKLARFDQAGIDEVVLVEFTQAFASLTPELFAEQVLSKGLGLKEVFVGQHFAFGHKRAGKIDDLRRLGEQFGFIVHPTPPVTLDGGIVSSTRIRQLIMAGQVAQAAQLLGRPYALSGIVVPGEGRGHALGCPTANLPLPLDRVTPADGIYTSITVVGADRHDSVTYIGSKPTFPGGTRGLEVSILDGRYDLYGHMIRVELIDRIRGDAQFDDEDALSRQIAIDVESARDLLRRYHDNMGA
ncbi:MAG: riboflavin biosynthesis protein RibF [Nitrospira sp.]|nr:riboflavin biosynthesis protein RibF [Nitrospira sp.]